MIFVEGGDHVLRVYQGKAGMKIRNVRLLDRGSCGFTDTRPVDPAAMNAETAECQARLTDLASSCPGGVPLPGLPELSLPGTCYSGCAGDFISFHADCRDLLQTDGVQGNALRILDRFLISCNDAPPPPPSA